jgi:hypothetical protein
MEARKKRMESQNVLPSQAQTQQAETKKIKITYEEY